MLTEAISVLEWLKELGTKRKVKDELLAKNSGNRILEQFFVLTYDWMRTYGMLVDDVEQRDDSVPTTAAWEAFLDLTSKLATRQISGNKAKQAWEEFLVSCTQREKYWYSKVLNRDLKIGVAEGTVAKIWPKALSPFGCQTAEEMESGKLVNQKNNIFCFPVLIEPKYDGLRTIIVVDGDKATVHSRNGKDMPGLGPLAAAFIKAAPGHYVIDGEIFADNWGQTVSLTKTYPENLTEEERQQLASLKYYAFDCLPLADFQTGYSNLKLLERWKLRDDIVELVQSSSPEANVVKTPYLEANSEDEISKVYGEFIKQGFEGAMIKYPLAPYKFGRTKYWLKLKPWRTYEGVIIGFASGSKGTKHENSLGAIIVQNQDGRVVRIGGGMSDKLRKEIWESRDEKLGKILEYKGQDDPNEVAVVRFPEYIRFRDDKSFL